MYKVIDSSVAIRDEAIATPPTIVKTTMRHEVNRALFRTFPSILRAPSGWRILANGGRVRKPLVQRFGDPDRNAAIAARRFA